jgi:hypothetical protein
MRTVRATIAIAVMLLAVSCVADDPILEEDEAAIASDPGTNIVVPGCDAPEWDPNRICDSNPGSGGGGPSGPGGGAGGGGGGGVCTPGTPGCHGPVQCPPGQRWNSTLGRCVHNDHGASCWNPSYPTWVCRIGVTGNCVCSPPPCSVGNPCPPPPP